VQWNQYHINNFLIQGIVYRALGEGTFLSHLIITFFLICTYLSHFFFALSFDTLIYLFKILIVILDQEEWTRNTFIFWRFQRCNERNITIETLLHDKAFMIEILITMDNGKKILNQNRLIIGDTNLFKKKKIQRTKNISWYMWQYLFGYFIKIKDININIQKFHFLD
jgi:hypothetical protein